MSWLSLYLTMRTLVTDRKGITALEYGLLAALIAIVLISGITLFGSNLNAFFTNLAARIAALPRP